MIKYKYNIYDLNVPYLRGIPDLFSLFYQLKKINSKKKNNKLRKIIILGNLISFFYHKIRMEHKTEKNMAILDNYFCAIRCYIGGILIFKKKGEKIRFFSIFISTILLFDYKNYVNRKYCFLPVICSLLCIRNKKDFIDIFPFISAFLFFLIEYYIILPFDLGKYFRNNKYFSNHEIFHIILYISENIYLKKIKS